MEPPTYTVEQQLRAQLVLARMANVQLTAQRDMLISIMRQEMHKPVAPANMFESLPMGQQASAAGQADRFQAGMRLMATPKTAFPFAPVALPAVVPPVASDAPVVAVLPDEPVTFASMAAKAAVTGAPVPVVHKQIVLPPPKTPVKHSDDDNVTGRLTPEQSMSQIEEAMRVIRTA